MRWIRLYGKENCVPCKSHRPNTPPNSKIVVRLQSNHPSRSTSNLANSRCDFCGRRWNRACHLLSMSKNPWKPWTLITSFVMTAWISVALPCIEWFFLCLSHVTIHRHEMIYNFDNETKRERGQRKSGTGTELNWTELTRQSNDIRSHPAKEGVLCSQDQVYG